jgi:hypothetical protein
MRCTNERRDGSHDAHSAKRRGFRIALELGVRVEKLPERVNGESA